MSGKSMEYNGRQENLIDENEYRNRRAIKQFYTGFVLKNDGTLVIVNKQYKAIGIASGDILPGIPGVTTIVAEPKEDIIYDPLLIAEAKRQLEPKWYPAGGQLNWFYGLGALAIESTPGTFRWRSGLASGNHISPKYYASGWRGGSRARITTRFVSGLGKMFGKVSVGIGIGLDMYGVKVHLFDDKYSDNAVSPSKFGLNLGITAYGYYIFGPASIGYFAVDSFYPGGFNQFMKDGSSAQDVENERNARNGGNAWTRPRIIPWGVK